MGASPPPEVGNWCSINGLTCGDGTRRSSGRAHRVLVRSRDRATSPIGLSNQIIAVGVRAFYGMGSGAEEGVAHLPYEPLGGDIFRRRGCGGSRGCSNHVSMDSSRGRFA